MRLDIYILRTVLGGTLVTLGALLGLAVILLLLDEIDKVEGAYTVGKVLIFVLYMLPGYMLEFFPLATLVGSLMALGQLAAGNEITAMRAAGVSLGRLARPVLVAGVLLGLAGMLIGETLGPLGQTQARLMRAEALGHTLSMQGDQGLWLREQERFVHVGYVTPGGELHQVRAFAFGPDQTLREGTLIDQAIPGAQGWDARKVTSNTFQPAEAVSGLPDDSSAAPAKQASGMDGRRDGEEGPWAREQDEPPSGAVQAVGMSLDAQRMMPALVPAGLLNVLVVLPQYMSMGELWRYARFLDVNGLESASYWLAWWGKLFAPLQVVAMLLLALPFALATRRTGGAGQRMVIGILLGLALLILTRLLTQGGLLIGLPPMLAALLPPVLFLALAILGLRRRVV